VNRYPYARCVDSSWFAIESAIIFEVSCLYEGSKETTLGVGILRCNVQCLVIDRSRISRVAWRAPQSCGSLVSEVVQWR
jgi:hypothetical protein